MTANNVIAAQREPMEVIAGANVNAIIAMVREAKRLDQVTEVRAQAEAVRAWAKVHSRVKEVRLDLLRLEVASLVRIVELGGEKQLPGKDRDAAVWLAGMSESERDAFIRKSGTATTAAGMCQSIWRQCELEKEVAKLRRHGEDLATAPPTPDRNEAVKAAKNRALDVAGVLADIADEYGSATSEFTVEEMADEVIERASISDELAEDHAVRDGIQRICREAIRKAPPINIDGTSLPRVITARTPEGRYIRVPVMRATMAHLDDMIAIREEQIRSDQESLEKLAELRLKLNSLLGTRARGTRLGDLVGTSVRLEAA